jgi:lysophospholipase L1-like esterase
LTFRAFIAAAGAMACLAQSPDPLLVLAQKLKQARGGSRLVRVLHFGDSHLGTREIHRAYADPLQGAFGEGGIGLGLPWVRPQNHLKAQASPGWRKGARPSKDSALGLAAGWLEASRRGEWAAAVGSFSRLRVHLHRRPGGGAVRILVDGQALGDLSLQGAASELVVFQRDLPPSGRPRRLEIQTIQDGASRILGVALEEAAGLSYSPLAFNGAEAAWLKDADPSLLEAQLRAEAPDLVLLAFGTNEASGPRFDGRAYRQSLETVLGLFRRGAPQAVLALAGPPDASMPRARLGALGEVVAIQREVAAQWGLVFLDQREAMGGSVAQWLRQGLARPDLVHFTPQGYQRLSRSLLLRLLQPMGLAHHLPAPGRLRRPQGGQGPAAAPAPGASHLRLPHPFRAHHRHRQSILRDFRTRGMGGKETP